MNEPVDDRKTGTWVTYVDGRADAIRIRRCRIEVVAGPDAGKTVELEKPHIQVGARPGSDLELTDRKVSGLHIEIRLDDKGYRLRDLESTNGTWVGGLRVNDAYLNPGTLIDLGKTRLRFDPLPDSVAFKLAATDRFGGMVGRSAMMRELFARLERVAATDATVLVTGPTGAGKELVAEAVHDHSPRRGGPFVVLDCGSIPANLVESELFGHEKGAFTGAEKAHQGVFERAHGGTVFLDELGELPLDLQPKLLRVLERKEVRRLGGSKIIPADIRVVAATNRDLAVEVNRGNFRADLYYRLAVAHVHVPPLRERREDIPLLVEHFLGLIPGGERTTLKPETLELLSKHDWPGNVRELRNVLERAVYLSEGAITSLGAAPQRRASAQMSAVSAPGGGTTSSEHTMAVPIDVQIPFKLAKQDMVEEFEKRYVTRLLEAHQGNVSAAARAAGIDRMSIHKMLNRLGLDNPAR